MILRNSINSSPYYLETKISMRSIFFVWFCILLCCWTLMLSYILIHSLTIFTFVSHFVLFFFVAAHISVTDRMVLHSSTLRRSVILLLFVKPTYFSKKKRSNRINFSRETNTMQRFWKEKSPRCNKPIFLKGNVLGWGRKDS